MNDLPPGHSGVRGPTGGDESAGCEHELADQLLGAADIVDAFTALRHELKLQVRNGRELQQSLEAGLQRLEQRLVRQPQLPSDGSTSNEARLLAAAIAEIDESLQRSIEMIPQRRTSSGESRSLADRFDRTVAHGSWAARTFSAGLLRKLRGVVEQSDDEESAADRSLDTIFQGLRLFHDRVRRLMQQCGIERLDVLHKPFDAEQMHAVDVVDSASVPSSHVAEQLRAAYRWHGKILRCADVRIAR